MRKLIILLLCGIPWAAFLPYMLNAWRFSPMDRFDWIFILLFAVFALSHLCDAREEGEGTKRDRAAILCAALCLLLLAAAFCLRIHAIGILASAGFWWCAAWILFGWIRAFRLLPVFLLLVCGCTSTTYWLGYVTGLQGDDALVLKFAAGFLLCGWDLAGRCFQWKIRRATACYLAALSAGVFLLSQAGGAAVTGPPLLPDFRKSEAGDFLGYEEEVSVNTRRFFQGCRVAEYRFADDAGTVSVLDVGLGEDIHKIHPPSHCLRSSGFQILSEYVRPWGIANGRIPLTEIQTRINGTPMLVAAWFSSEELCCGNFLSFRASWTRETQWRMIQLSTPAGDGWDAARARLEKLLNALSSAGAAEDSR